MEKLPLFEKFNNQKINESAPELWNYEGDIEENGWEDEYASDLVAYNNAVQNKVKSIKSVELVDYDEDFDFINMVLKVETDQGTFRFNSAGDRGVMDYVTEPPYSHVKMELESNGLM